MVSTGWLVLLSLRLIGEAAEGRFLPGRAWSRGLADTNFPLTAGTGSLEREAGEQTEGQERQATLVGWGLWRLKRLRTVVEVRKDKSLGGEWAPSPGLPSWILRAEHPPRRRR